MIDALDLLILDSGKPDLAVAYARYGPDVAIEFLDCKEIVHLNSFHQKLKLVASNLAPRPTLDELAAFGRDLFQFAVHKQLLKVYNRLPDEYIRIQVLSNQSDVQALPWEYLQDPDPNTAAGPNNIRSVIRIVPTIGQSIPKPRKLTGKIKILFAYADPVDEAAVAWEDIAASIKQMFTTRNSSDFEMDIIPGTTAEELARALAAKKYDIFQFSGHGELVADANGNQIGNLVLLEPGTKNKQLIAAETLALMFKGRNLQLVVLSSCNSSAGDFSKSYSVIAQALVQSGVPAVVANQLPVTNGAAATFAAGFYQTLLNSGDVDRAVADGRGILALQPKKNKNEAKYEWGIPTLYRHINAAQLFEV